MRGAGLIEVERIGVLHEELAPPHHPEARTHLVAELPLDVIEVERQLLVGLHIGAEDLGDHLLVGRPVQHLALVAIGDAQHLLAIGFVAVALAPQFGRLDGRHEQFDGAGAVLLLAHDLLNLPQDAQAERQEGINAGRLLPQHAGAQHQPVRDDFRLPRGFAQDRQEIAGKAHRGSLYGNCAGTAPSALESGSAGQKQGDRALGNRARTGY